MVFVSKENNAFPGFPPLSPSCPSKQPKPKQTQVPNVVNLAPQKCRFSKKNSLFSFNFEQTMISFRYLSIFRTTFSLKCVFPCACGISLGNHLQSQNCFSSVLLSWPISHESLEISGPLTCRIHILAKTQRDVGQHEREPG